MVAYTPKKVIDSNKQVLSTVGVSKELISKFLMGNRFHVKLRILSPYSNLYELISDAADIGGSCVDLFKD